MTKLDTLEDVKLSQGVHVVKFGADWCQPCKQMDSIIQELSEEMKYVKFSSIDINNVAKECTELGIRTVPTIVKFENGVSGDRRIGLINKEALKEWVHQ